MNILQPPDTERAKLYETMQPQAAKFIMPDGSIVDSLSAMNVISAPDAKRAEIYKSMSPTAAKILMPDGSIVDT